MEGKEVYRFKGRKLKRGAGWDAGQPAGVSLSWKIRPPPPSGRARGQPNIRLNKVFRALVSVRRGRAESKASISSAGLGFACFLQCQISRSAVQRDRQCRHPVTCSSAGSFSCHWKPPSWIRTKCRRGGHPSVFVRIHEGGFQWHEKEPA